MIDEQRLREGLQRLLRDTETAIRERISDEPSIEAQLRERHAAAVRAGRTTGSAAGYNSFADEAITQAAVHWLLGCVFVRFLEDNGWLDERNRVVAWLAGPGERLATAKANRTLFLRPDPALTDREYLVHVFGKMAELPGMAGLFDRVHNPLFQLGPTAQGAAKIVEFFQQVDPDIGTLIHNFTDPEHRTRFLGDLYQNLSEAARKRYALCQTPGFVIDFILDRTLTPGLDAFGLEQVRLIDPSCGSGHFLLAAFARLFRLWQRIEPATNPSALVQKALGAIYGIDLNPFAVEITRFRLLIAALQASEVTPLCDAPAFQFNVATGDTLLHGTRPNTMGIQREFGEDRFEHFYATEDRDEVQRILSQEYHVVIGNPPYNNVGDSVLREGYRQRFLTCYGKYQLSCPFFERFFDLTISATENHTAAGFMAMIVSNAFMKRSFGRKLIEEYLINKDLTHIIDTSGVYLDGFGTPTVVVIGRNQRPVSSRVRAVRGKRGEMVRPEDPARSPVWLEIAAQADHEGFDGDYVSVDDVPRDSFAHYPWSIGGGGAAELQATIEENARGKLGSLASSIGITCFTLEDDIYQLDRASALRHRIPLEHIRHVVEGGMVREWTADAFRDVYVFPYDDKFDPIPDGPNQATLRYLWVARTNLSQSMMFGGKNKVEAGLRWYEYGRLTAHKLKSPLSICFSGLATHNHFVLDRGGRIFNRWAPVVKLSGDVSEDKHIEVLGLLNSSIACFWLKQVCHDKGSGGIGGGLATEPWERFYEFDSTSLQSLPLPKEMPSELAAQVQHEVDAYTALIPESICSIGVPTREGLDRARLTAAKHLGRMIALQEEIDWLWYRLYGILDEQLTAPIEQIPGLEVGERAFEISMARQMRGGASPPTWFERHRSKPTPQPPLHWSDAYRDVCLRRVEVIENNRDIALIEQPAYKRRWNLPTWDEMEQSALKNWLLARMEASVVWHERILISCGRLRDALARDTDWVSVSRIYGGVPAENLDDLVTRLVVAEAVPFLPVLRYTEAGLRKRREWEEVWELQREEDEGETVQVPVPRKYRSNDFQKSDYWRLRGGLDVPKERFILYPGLERDADASPVLGWAGWDHLEQARALAGYYQRMRTEEGWEPERLKPILAGVLDLKPWLLQWHNELDPETGVRLGEYFVQFAESQCQDLGFSPEDVRAWQPAAVVRPSRRGRRSGQSDARRSQ